VLLPRSPVSIGAARRSFAPWRDAAATPLIRFEGLTKRFGDLVAVDDLTLDIYEREFFCLLGPSGCGKSTLLRLLAGFDEPTSGRILLDGEDLAGVPPHRRPVNMMFQSYALFPHLSVEGNVAYGLKQQGLPRPEIAARVGELLRLVQLVGSAERRPDQLSGGQRQRVALARALAREPKVLLLDEPLAALDKRLREDTQFELMDLQVRLGTTFIVVTHDQDEAMTMADRIAVMQSGRIAQVGMPGEVYEQPQTRFVAAFLGDVNMFEGRVLGDEGGGLTIQASSSPQPLFVDASGATPGPGQAVAVAVRPEKMELHLDPPVGRRNLLAGTVWDIGYLGDSTTYRVRLDTGEMVKASRANARRSERPIAWEERVYVSFAPDAAIVLTR
jgi:putrescine transport system ATP-binding protein